MYDIVYVVDYRGGILLYQENVKFDCV